jgi:tetratricopeptide (TPR) repeat protein
MRAMNPDAAKNNKSKAEKSSDPAFAGTTAQSSPVNMEFIERCQIEYERNPTSRIFAPLAEGYRRLRLIDEAYDVARRGVRQHPEFAAGRIAFARILIEKEEYQDAVEQLKTATELSPDNILAFLLLGETLLKLRRPKEALAAFKMVLFLNPLHASALKMVQKWEFLTADEFADDVFEWSQQDVDRALQAATPNAQTTAPKTKTESALLAGHEADREADRQSNRAISIADALTVRNDIEGAFEHILRAVRSVGLRPDLEHRLTLLGKRMGLNREESLKKAGLLRSTPHPQSNLPLPRESSSSSTKRQKLQNLLKKVQRKSGDN